MKITTYCIIALTILLSYKMFSQVNDRWELRPDNLLQEKIIPHSIQDNNAEHPFKSDIVSDKESRTLVNKTILDNGFLLIEELRQEWDDSSWVNWLEYTYSYDENNNLIEELIQLWSDSSWVNAGMINYTYDSNNNLIEELEQNWDGSNWVIRYKYTYNYVWHNSMIIVLMQHWNGSNWRNLLQDTYTYDWNNNLSEQLGQTWDSYHWMNSSKYTYTYDGNNNMIEELRQESSGIDWVNNVKNTFIYDENHNMIESLEQEWDGSNWMNDLKVTYAHIFSGIEQELDYELFQNYPNPFNAATTIRYELPQDGVVTLKIYDILGQEVASILNEFKTANWYEVDFSAIGLPSGVYFYRLQSGSFVETKKMVLLK